MTACRHFVTKFVMSLGACSPPWRNLRTSNEARHVLPLLIAMTLVHKSSLAAPWTAPVAAALKRLLYAGTADLSDSELLAIAAGLQELGTAATLLDRHRGLQGLEEAGLRELAAGSEVGLLHACRLKAALALGRRLSAVRPPTRLQIRSAKDVWDVCGMRLAAERREIFLALALDSRNRVQGEVTVAVGMLSTVEVQPREAFRALIRESAAGVVFAHNHPSGDPAPSADDRDVSRRLVQVGKVVGIRVLDHVVVATGGYASAIHDSTVHRVSCDG
jgi:DNA repair protein RadC